MVEKATFAAGCFWGVEHLYNKHFKIHGIQTKVGYIGGKVHNPTYYEICSGKSGHAEAVEITFDSSKISYATLAEFFYRIHDPTTLNRQGPDKGPQYRSAIFYHSPEQKLIADQITKDVQQKYFINQHIVTEILPANELFYIAEDDHQMYLEKNPYGYECPTHFLRW